MFGTLIYTLLDVGLNITIWTTKTISSGIYHGYHYFINNDESEMVDEPISTDKLVSFENLLMKINTQKECIDRLKAEMIELQEFNKSFKSI
tara:strand:- start:3017 stop:3289 length:273 start_codon:yes stop_codon:yes gene_type:complete